MNAPANACEIEIRVRYAEVDQMGLLHNSRYWIYFELGRTELLRQLGTSHADLERDGIFLVVAQCAAKFLAPAHYDDVLILTTRVARTGRASLVHAYELRRPYDNVRIATGQTTLACTDGKGRIIPLPEAVRQARPS